MPPATQLPTSRQKREPENNPGERIRELFLKLSSELQLTVIGDLLDIHTANKGGTIIIPGGGEQPHVRHVIRSAGSSHEREIYYSGTVPDWVNDASELLVEVGKSGS